MGLPQIEIEFKIAAQTAVQRSEQGIVAVILIDATKTGDEYASYTYNCEADIVKAHWTAANLDYLNKIFMGGPKRVLVERGGTDGDYDSALPRLKNKNWNYLCIPGYDMRTEDTEAIANWIIAQRAAKKTFKAVLPNSASNHEGIINFATEGIKAGAKSYTTGEYCARIAGILAGLPLDRSATYYPLPEVTGITESLTPDVDIDAGKLILVNDGEKVKIGRGINSLVTLTDGKTEDMKKIKIVEGMDLIRDDIKTTFEQNYIGVNNTYDNKQLFIAAVNQYFKSLVRQGILYDQAENTAYIDLEAQRDYLEQKQDVSDWSEDQIRTAKTGSWIFAGARVTFADAAEDLKFSVSME